MTKELNTYHEKLNSPEIAWGDLNPIILKLRQEKIKDFQLPRMCQSNFNKCPFCRDNPKELEYKQARGMCEI